jgi:hypothetical protein
MNRQDAILYCITKRLHDSLLITSLFGIKRLFKSILAINSIKNAIANKVVLV